MSLRLSVARLFLRISNRATTTIATMARITMAPTPAATMNMIVLSEPVLGTGASIFVREPGKYHIQI